MSFPGSEFTAIFNKWKRTANGLRKLICQLLINRAWSQQTQCLLRKPVRITTNTLVDKFYPPTTSAKPALESIDIYEPSVRCAAFCTTESRLLCCILVFKTKYLTSEVTGYEAVWKEQEAYSLLSKCGKTVIFLFLKTRFKHHRVVRAQLGYWCLWEHCANT